MAVRGGKRHLHGQDVWVGTWRNICFPFGDEYRKGEIYGRYRKWNRGCTLFWLLSGIETSNNGWQECGKLDLSILLDIVWRTAFVIFFLRHKRLMFNYTTHNYSIVFTRSLIDLLKKLTHFISKRGTNQIKTFPLNRTSHNPKKPSSTGYRFPFSLAPLASFIIFSLIASLNYSFIHLTPSTQSWTLLYGRGVEKVHPKYAKLRDKTPKKLFLSEQHWTQSPSPDDITTSEDDVSCHGSWCWPLN